MNETCREANTPIERVYLPAARWHTLLQALRQANQPPHDQAAALSSIVDFLNAIPAVRDAGIINPLEQLLAALPDLLRLASCWNQLTAELRASGKDAPTMAEMACVQLRAILRFATSVAGEPITRPLLPLTELLAAAELEAQGHPDFVSHARG